MDFDAFSPELLKYAKSLHPEPPRYLGTRYDRSGVFKPEPGNTIVCHVTEGSQTQRAMVAARQNISICRRPDNSPSRRSQACT